MAKFQKTDNANCLQGHRATGILILLTVEMESAVITLESSLAVSCQTEHSLSIQSSITLLGIYSSDLKTCVHKNSSMRVFIAAFCWHCQKEQTSKCPSSPYSLVERKSAFP